jgi:hypothetical protein
MADRSLFNEDLTLSKLTVNNSTSSSASGYVPQSTIITAGGMDISQITLTSATYPDVTITNASGTVYTPDSMNVNGTITTNASVSIGNTLIIKDGFSSPNDVVLSCPQNNVLNVAGSTITTNVELLSLTGNINLTAPSGNTLQVGGNLQAIGSVTSANLTLVSGTNSTTLTQSPTTNNTLVLTGDLEVGNSITLPTNAFAFVSAPTFSGGVASARFTPPTPGAWNCGPGTVTPIVLPAFTFNPVTSALNCPYFFTVQTSNNVTVSVASYSLAQVGTQVTMTLQIANLQAAGGAVVSISVLAFNPSA